MSSTACWTELATTDLTVTTPRRAGARTSVIAVTASCEEVFKALADIEALPRWADGFCEAVYVDQGNWRGLTALGELWLELETNVREGSIALLAGHQLGDSRRVEWQVVPAQGGGTRLSIRVEATSDELQKRLFAAIETELWTLTTRWGGGVRAEGQERAG